MSEELMLPIDKALPKEIKEEDLKDWKWQSDFFKAIEDREVPLDLIKERKGAYNKELQDYEMLEYFPEEYTLSELNRIFPGWWTEDMHYKFFPELRTIVVDGYLCVEYPTVYGKKPTKRWAVGASRILFTKSVNEVTGKPDASQPDDQFKAARTEWIKLAGKHYGIGLELYHQRITPKLRSRFEDIVRDWGIYANEVKAIAKTFTKGHGFRNFIKSLPTPEDTARLLKAIDKLKDKPEAVDKIFKEFVKNRRNSPENIKKLNDFLTKIEAFANNNKTKEK